jgi:hypothetical protein
MVEEKVFTLKTLSPKWKKVLYQVSKINKIIKYSTLHNKLKTKRNLGRRISWKRLI